MNSMIASLIQCLVTDDKNQNLENVLIQIESAVAESQAGLVILPELWNSPFINERIKAHIEEWNILIPALCAKAKELGIWIIAGTIPRSENGRTWNSCAVIDNNGKIIAIADKSHLLEVHTAKHSYYESEVFTPGNSLCKVDTPWGKIGILICFDNRFPEAARLLAKDCVLLVCPCGFNEHVGKKHWHPLFQTRAMENEIFVAAVNPAAHDYGTYRSYGHSMIVDPDGQIAAELGPEPGNLAYEFDFSQVDQIRKRSPFWKIRRTDLYSLKETSAKECS